LHNLIELYEASDKPEKAEEWSLEALSATETEELATSVRLARTSW